MLYRVVKLMSSIVSMLPNTVWRGIGNMLGEVCWWVVLPRKRRIMAIDNIMRGLSVDQKQATHIA
jgi:KDO2-lipid IV(A) lauroyltransferase